jgi:hypothetical protein
MLMIGGAHHERETIGRQAGILKRAKHQIATLDLVLGSDRRHHSNMMANLRQIHEHSDRIDLDHRRPEQGRRLQEGLDHLANRALRLGNRNRVGQACRDRHAGGRRQPGDGRAA